MEKQKRLTAEQAQKFYAEYVKAKAKRMDVGGPAPFSVWKNQMELYLSEEDTGANWSNTEIRHANRQLARSATAPGERIMSDKQSRLFARYLDKEDNAAMRQKFAAEYGLGEKEASRYVREHPGVVFAFLTQYGSEEWNEYFNS